MVSNVMIGFLSIAIPSPEVSAGSACEHDSRNFRCVKYIRNYDADTITVTIPNIHPLLGDEIPIRILGIDTPELRTQDSCEKEIGLKARDMVSGILKNAKRIDLENVSRDKYFRIDADVVVDGKSIREVLLKANFAYQYSGGTKQKKDWCKASMIAH